VNGGHVAAVALLLAVAAGDGAAQAPDCSRLPAMDGPMGYAPRDGHARCEGFFESPVGAAALEVVYALTSPLAFDPDKDAVLLVAPPSKLSSPAEPVAVTAVALSPQTYYRMDAVVAAGEPMRWPLDAVVRPAAMGPDDLGVWGWAERAGLTVYVPVRVWPESSGEGAPDAGRPILGLRAATELARVMWREQGADGPLGDWAVLAEGPLFAGDVVRLDVPDGAAPTARLELAAEQRATGRWLRREVQIWRGAP
jgi:hypothetical protein